MCSAQKERVLVDAVGWPSPLRIGWTVEQEARRSIVRRFFKDGRENFPSRIAWITVASRDQGECLLVLKLLDLVRKYIFWRWNILREIGLCL